MNILAIDTSGAVASVSILNVNKENENKILGEININYGNNHSVIMMPIIDMLLNTVKLKVDDIDYFALTNGPGSFTGLRIGASIIKAMAHITNKNIIPISTLEVLAYNIFSPQKYIVAMIDAKVGRVFAGIYKNGICILEDEAFEIQEILKYIKKNGFDAVFVGDGAKIYKNEIEEIFGQNVIAYDSMNYQKAVNIALIAIKYIQMNKFVNYNELNIKYIRKPQAQRELEERLKYDNSTKNGA